MLYAIRGTWYNFTNIDMLSYVGHMYWIAHVKYLNHMDCSAYHSSRSSRPSLPHNIGSPVRYHPSGSSFPPMYTLSTNPTDYILFYFRPSIAYQSWAFCEFDFGIIPHRIILCVAGAYHTSTGFERSERGRIGSLNAHTLSISGHCRYIACLNVRFKNKSINSQKRYTYLILGQLFQRATIPFYPRLWQHVITISCSPIWYSLS
jgi:hypothetical protein